MAQGGDFTMLKLNKIAIALALLGMTSVASAQVYEMSFVDSNNATVVKSPSLTWYNPTGSVSVTAISGLDRKIKLELLKGTTVVETQTSALITLANRIVASDGKEFYGIKFSLSTPAEGNYILRSTVLDIKGVVVTSTDYTFNVDTSGPTTTNSFVFSNSSGTGGSMNVFGADSAGNSITLGGLTDASGIESATYYTIDAGGTRREKATTFSATSPVVWNVKTSFAAATNVAPVQGRYTIGLSLKDYAGNFSKFENLSYIDSVKPPYSIEVWNSVDGIWMPLANSVSYENPVKFRYNIPKTGLVAYNGTNYGYVQNTHYTDATTGYMEYTAVVPQNNSKYWRLTTLSGLYTDFNAPALDVVKLQGSAGPAPKVKSFSYGVTGQPMVASNQVRFNKPYTIDRIQVFVEARPYPQTASYNSITCQIPVGSTDCTLNTNISNSVGRGYATPGMYVKNADNTVLKAFGGYLYTWWDFNPPVMDEFSYQPDTRKFIMRVTDNDRLDNSQIGMWDTRSFVVKATNSQNQVITVPMILSRDDTYKNKDAEFNAASLPDGDYSITGTATDIDGNATSMTISNLVLDPTPPVITITNTAGSMSQVETLKTLRVSVTDNHDHDPVITSMSLTGGPINDNLELGYSKVADGYQPEVPRMFPTIEAGQDYTLKVQAKDDQGNKTTLSKTFSLSPQNVVVAPSQNVLAVAKSLLDSHNRPLAQVTFKGALTDGGTQSRGIQAAFFTLRRDSQFSVMFNGDRVAPGETKEVVIPLDVSGNAAIPVWPADPGVTGRANYLIDIPQLTVN